MQLSVVRSKTPDRGQENKDPAFLRAAHHVVKSSNGECSNCGFSPGRYIRVVEKNNNYTQFKPESLQAVCPFCFHCHRLEQAKGKGRMIYLPELNQVQLNYLVHSCWAVTNRHEEIQPSFGYSVIYHLNFLLERTEPIESVFKSQKASHPEYFAKMLKGLPEEAYMARSEILKDVRFLPVREGMADEAAYWSTHIYNHFVHTDIEKWLSIGQRVSHRVLDKDNQKGE